ncbi:probable serine/threonine-protein kinase DDB_G0282963 [Leptopilina boulardi]|uniref:probable serine/threonine-protein kinase DDB_G0282963 n=1 Tax=Leptopilina boulardi TaxID=63433 RepID=UPI0021F64D6A|nr:probable serine/threonine-protein kinase DDB_G0282963 [Leptopilina boulardi]
MADSNKTTSTTGVGGYDSCGCCCCYSSPRTLLPTPTTNKDHIQVSNSDQHELHIKQESSSRITHDESKKLVFNSNNTKTVTSTANVDNMKKEDKKENDNQVSNSVDNNLHIEQKTSSTGIYGKEEKIVFNSSNAKITSSTGNADNTKKDEKKENDNQVSNSVDNNLHIEQKTSSTGSYGKEEKLVLNSSNAKITSSTGNADNTKKDEKKENDNQVSNSVDNNLHIEQKTSSTGSYGKEEKLVFNSSNAKITTSTGNADNTKKDEKKENDNKVSNSVDNNLHIEQKTSSTGSYGKEEKLVFNSSNAKITTSTGNADNTKKDEKKENDNKVSNSVDNNLHIEQKTSSTGSYGKEEKLVFNSSNAKITTSTGNADNTKKDEKKENDNKVSNSVDNNLHVEQKTSSTGSYGKEEKLVLNSSNAKITTSTGNADNTKKEEKKENDNQVSNSVDNNLHIEQKTSSTGSYGKEEKLVFNSSNAEITTLTGNADNTKKDEKKENDNQVSNSVDNNLHIEQKTSSTGSYGKEEKLVFNSSNAKITTSTGNADNTKKDEKKENDNKVSNSVDNNLHVEQKTSSTGSYGKEEKLVLNSSNAKITTSTGNADNTKKEEKKENDNQVSNSVDNNLHIEQKTSSTGSYGKEEKLVFNSSNAKITTSTGNADNTKKDEKKENDNQVSNSVDNNLHVEQKTSSTGSYGKEEKLVLNSSNAKITTSTGNADNTKKEEKKENDNQVSNSVDNNLHIEQKTSSTGSYGKEEKLVFNSSNAKITTSTGNADNTKKDEKKENDNQVSNSVDNNLHIEQKTSSTGSYGKEEKLDFNSSNAKITTSTGNADNTKKEEKKENYYKVTDCSDYGFVSSIAFSEEKKENDNQVSNSGDNNLQIEQKTSSTGSYGKEEKLVFNSSNAEITTSTGNADNTKKDEKKENDNQVSNSVDNNLHIEQKTSSTGSYGKEEKLVFNSSNAKITTSTGNADNTKKDEKKENDNQVSNSVDNNLHIEQKTSSTGSYGKEEKLVFNSSNAKITTSTGNADNTKKDEKKENDNQVSNSGDNNLQIEQKTSSTGSYGKEEKLVFNSSNAEITTLTGNADNTKKDEKKENDNQVSNSVDNILHIEQKTSSTGSYGKEEKLVFNSSNAKITTSTGNADNTKKDEKKENDNQVSNSVDNILHIEQKTSSTGSYGKEEKLVFNSSNAKISSSTGNADNTKKDEKKENDNQVSNSVDNNLHIEQKTSSTGSYGKEEKLVFNSSNAKITTSTGNADNTKKDEKKENDNQVSNSGDNNLQIEQKTSSTGSYGKEEKLVFNSSNAEITTLTGNADNTKKDEKKENDNQVSNSVDNILHIEQKTSSTGSYGKEEKLVFNSSNAKITTSTGNADNTKKDEKKENDNQVSNSVDNNLHIEQKTSSTGSYGKEEKLDFNSSNAKITTSTGNADNTKKEEKKENYYKVTDCSDYGFVSSIAFSEEKKENDNQVSNSGDNNLQIEQKTSSTGSYGKEEKLVFNSSNAEITTSTGNADNTKKDEKKENDNQVSNSVDNNLHIEQKTSSTGSYGKEEKLVFNSSNAKITTSTGNADNTKKDEKKENDNQVSNSVDNNLHIEQKTSSTGSYGKEEKLIFTSSNAKITTLSDNADNTKKEEKKEIGKIMSTSDELEVHAVNESTTSSSYVEKKIFDINVEKNAALAVNAGNTKTGEKKEISKVISTSDELKVHTENESATSSRHVEKKILDMSNAGAAEICISDCGNRNEINNKESFGSINSDKMVHDEKKFDASDRLVELKNSSIDRSSASTVGVTVKSESTKQEEKKITEAMSLSGERTVHDEKKITTTSIHSNVNSSAIKTTNDSAAEIRISDCGNQNEIINKESCGSINSDKMVHDEKKFASSNRLVETTEKIVKIQDDLTKVSGTQLKGKVSQINEGKAVCQQNNTVKNTLKNIDQDIVNKKCSITKSAKQDVVDIKNNQEDKTSEQSGILSKLVGFFAHPENEVKIDIKETNKESKQVKKAEKVAKSIKAIETIMGKNIKVITMEFIEDCKRGTIEEKMSKAGIVVFKTTDDAKSLKNEELQKGCTNNTKKQPKKDECCISQPMKKEDKLPEKNDNKKTKGSKGKKGN